MKRKVYGCTTPKCFFCGDSAISKNSQGLITCSKCKDKKNDIRCPVCNNELEVRDGKFGDYFYCFSCNKNWSKAKIQRFG